jgi:hypothetical protein
VASETSYLEVVVRANGRSSTIVFESINKYVAGSREGSFEIQTAHNLRRLQ